MPHPTASVACFGGLFCGLGVGVIPLDCRPSAPGKAAGEDHMYGASANVVLPTSIIGSLPRPAWYDAVLGSQTFLEAMANSRHREQYEDAVSVFLRAQEIAGLDIVTDGDAHYDEQVGGMSWQSYAPLRMAGFDRAPRPTQYSVGAVPFPRGHILHD